MTTKELDVEEGAIVAVAVSVLLYKFYLNTILPINQLKMLLLKFFKQLFYSFISFFTPRVGYYIFFGLKILFFLLLVCLYTQAILKIETYLNKKKSHKAYVTNLESRFHKLINVELNNLNYKELKDFASGAEELYLLSTEYKAVNKFTHDVEELIIQAEKLIEQKEHERKISELDEEESDKEQIIKELDRKIYLRQLAEQDKRRDIANRLNIGEHSVFKRDNLNEKQIVALLENGYSKMAEYCILDKKIKNFLIYPTSNHSRTHTFLVWNVRELLKRTAGIEKIKEHESVDADLTFKYKSKTYALEIETGTLLGKKKQTQEKVNFLNQKYPNRWFFIVSNKTLLPKYKKLGSATPRKEVFEKLQKMLKIAQF